MRGANDKEKTTFELLCNTSSATFNNLYSREQAMPQYLSLLFACTSNYVLIYILCILRAISIDDLIGVYKFQNYECDNYGDSVSEIVSTLSNAYCY